jgi:Protein of unknown function (DUF4197)
MIYPDNLDRRFVLQGGVALLTMGLASPLEAALSAGSLRTTLGGASDKALDKLALPDGFYRDLAVRILLPGSTGKLASKLMKSGDKLGLTSKLTKSLNDAASLAAGEAKPIFRKSIDGLQLTDLPGIALKNDGATQFLRSTAGSDLEARIRPLMVSALGKMGAFTQLAKLGNTASLLGLKGLTQDGLSDSVTKQAMNGIFSYMGKEEAGLRGNVLGIGKSLLDVVK